MVAMRDGTPLATDIYFPDRGGPFPTLVARVPYNKELTGSLNFSFDVLRGAQAGYAIAIQDVRGRYASGGTFDPFVNESLDGEDTVTWAAAQPWSNGAVG